MNAQLKNDADIIVSEAIAAVQPDAAVCRALEHYELPKGRLILIAVGKAAWNMADAAVRCLHKRPDAGAVITKYGHSRGNIDGLRIIEAGHPVPDGNSVAGARAVMELTADLSPDDGVLLLLSGGGSALFELPVIPLDKLESLTGELLRCGADIAEINTVRKHLSRVKGGGFGLHCAPARVYSIVLSDVLGNRPDVIASGPAVGDHTTIADARAVLEKYAADSFDDIAAALVETPDHLDNSEAYITGSVSELCAAAEKSCARLGYETIMLTDRLDCEAREAGRFLAAIAETYQSTEHSMAFIAGGETVVHVTGGGKGGRNQETALAAAQRLAALRDTALFSVGSDGTDGPTDAAGGYVDNDTLSELCLSGVEAEQALRDNDSYNALKACGGLIITGPTGTNVNDVAVLLIKR